MGVEEIHNFYSSPYSICVSKLRRMRGMKQCTMCEKRDMNTQFWWGELRERNHLENLGIDGRIIAKCNFKK
jgi:hypothetical protein